MAPPLKPLSSPPPALTEEQKALASRAGGKVGAGMSQANAAYSREEALAEAYKRGILPDNLKAAYEEAQRRGMVRSGEANDSPADPRFMRWPQNREGQETAAFTKNAWRGLSREGRQQAISDAQASGAIVKVEQGWDERPQWKRNTDQFLGNALNTTTGFINFLATPGREADKLLAKGAKAVGAPYPELEFDTRAGSRKFGLSDATMRDPREKQGLSSVQIDKPRNFEEGAYALGGTVAGYLAPGGLVDDAVKGVAQVGKTAIPQASKVAAAITPKGADMFSRLSRYGGRLAATVPAAGAHAFMLGVSSETDPEKKVQAGAELATNPITYAAVPAMSALYRAGVGAKTLGSRMTPTSVMVDTARQFPSTVSGLHAPPSALDALKVPTGISGKTADKVGQMLHRALSTGGVSDDVIDDAVMAYNQLAQSSKSAPPSLALFLRQRLAAYPQAIKNVDDALYEIGQSAPEVEQAIRSMRGSQGQRLSRGLGDNLGKKTRAQHEVKISREMEDLGENVYEPIIRNGPVDEKAGDDLRTILNDPEFLSQVPIDYKTQLSMAARGSLPQESRATIALQQRIGENPLEVAHRLYSALGKRMKGMAPGPERSRLIELRDALRDPLDRAGGRAYREARADYRKAAQAREAGGFADRLLTQASKIDEVRSLVDDYRGMEPRQKVVARSAIREAVENEMRLASAAADDGARLGRLKREGVLDAIETILNGAKGSKGTQVRQQIEAIIDEQALIKGIDPIRKAGRQGRLESGRGAYAGRVAAGEYSGRYGMSEIAQDAGLSMVFGQPVPPRLALRVAQKAAAYMATPGKSTRGGFARVLLEPPVAGQASSRGSGRRPIQDRPARPVAVASAQPRSDSQKAANNMARDGKGRFLRKQEILDPEAPPTATASRATDDQRPAQQSTAVGRPAPSQVDRPRYWAHEPDPTPGQTVVAAVERRVAEIQRAAQEAEAKRIAEQTRLVQAERDRQAIADARSKEIRAESQARSTQKRVDKTAQRAQEREDANATLGQPEAPSAPPAQFEGPRPFSEAGRLIDRMRAPAGDAQTQKRALQYLIGDADAKVIQGSLRRIGREGQVADYDRDVADRALDLLMAARGGRAARYASREAREAVAGMNAENRRWLEGQLSNPGSFDLEALASSAQATTGPAERALRNYGPPTVATILGGGAYLAALKQAEEYNKRGIKSAEHQSIDKLPRRVELLPNQVEDLKRKLKEMGYYSGTLSPTLSHDLKSAVQAFEKQTGMDVASLLYGSGKISPRVASGKIEFVLDYEDPAPAEIKRIQRALNKMGYRDKQGQALKVDGAAGRRFREALMQFQTAEGIPHGARLSGLNEETEQALSAYYD